MFEIDFTRPAHIHFIGIGGISMSGLAEVVLERGFTVSGSDNHESILTQHLAQAGAEIFYGQRAENIPEKCDLCVYTAAIHPDNPEYAEAVKRGITMLSRAELLGALMKNYGTAIAVSGTHGKTTTTSMVSCILLAADKDPTVSVGGMLPAIGGNIRVGNSDTFVTEACEYTDSFLSFFPTVALILNVEEDHLDYFGNLENIRSSFRRFAGLLPDDGLLVINAAIDDVSFFYDGLDCRVVTFGEGGDFYAEDISYDDLARPSFTCKKGSEVIGRFTLKVPGRHNVDNALAAIACTCSLDVSVEDIEKGLSEFSGTDRRFQKLGEANGVTIIDDYAHHPTEIRACLTTAQNYPHKKLWCVFQPHTYTRTAAFLQDFADALSLADEVILSDIYAAREENTVGVSSGDIAEKIRENGKEALYIPEFEDIAENIRGRLSEGDLLITLGAGEAFKVGRILLKEE